MVDTSDAWIVERTGIRERHILDPSLAASDLATEAGRAGLPQGGRRSVGRRLHHRRDRHRRLPVPGHRDLRAEEAGRAQPAAARSICRRPAPASSTACRSPTPSSARAVQARAGHRRRGAVAHRRLDRSLDLRAVRRRRGRRADDGRTTSGRRGGSCRRTSSPTAALTEILWQPAGGSREPLTPEALAAKRHFVKMNGREVYKHAVRNMAAAARTALEANGLTPDDVAWVIAHQANLRILEGVSERVGDPDVALLHQRRSLRQHLLGLGADRARRGDRAGEAASADDLLIFAALGGGLAWASAAVRW